MWASPHLVRRGAPRTLALVTRTLRDGVPGDGHLLRLSRPTAEGRIVVSPPPTHAELAARISTHREAVTKILNALEREGAIARTRGAIALTNVAHLRRVVAEAG